MTESQSELQPLLRHEDIEATPVYPIIHMIRSDVIRFIDTPLTHAAMTAPDLMYTLVLPLVDKYLAIQRKGNLSVVFCLLLNRLHFLQDEDILTASLSRSRAELCEILAIRIFRDLGNSMLQLILALTTTWCVYNGADPNVINQARQERDDDLEERVGNAIELAILGKAKNFIKSSSCQKVINAIWAGQCVYQAESSHSILSDTYKRTPVHFYDPHKAPLLDHYRLKVPAIRSVLEYINFLLLFILFVITIEVNERDRINFPEAVFIIYSLGFSLEKIAAMQEHGIKVFFKGTWNGFDLAFITGFAVYAFFRLYGVYHHNAWAREFGIDCLALIACLMFPRLAFVTLKDNLMVLSLRAMMVQFLFLMCIAAFCFCGFLYALWTLSRNEAGYGVGTIAWWMLDLWFGLDASGFDKANRFHPLFGPILMVTYACLSNTLLLTVLVSILSNTFATINEDAAAEAMFRKAVSTIEGVKADSLFSYQPPINLAALCVMLPASYLLSPRWFHKVNVFMIRLTSFPVLLLIALYERQSKIHGTDNVYDTLSALAEKCFDALPRPIKRMNLFEGFRTGSDAEINEIFEIEEEFGSALDINEDGLYVQTPIERRNIQPTSGRPTVSPPQSPRKRVNSMPSRGNEAMMFTSPLAQIYQPLIVDEGIPEEPGKDGDTFSQPSAPAPLPAVSYGPVTRRRLLSMQPGNSRPITSHYAAGRKLTSAPKLSSSPNHQFLSTSPEAMAKESPATDTASLRTDTYDTGTASEFGRRLEDIERRQKRIEDMLSQIATDIRDKK